MVFLSPEAMSERPKFHFGSHWFPWTSSLSWWLQATAVSGCGSSRSQEPAVAEAEAVVKSSSV